MQATVSLNKKLSVRKVPSQARSREMVEEILAATRRLMMRPGGLRLSMITTNHIAKAAGISVGSLYQYFPNKETIVFELYKRMLEQVSSVLEEFKTEKYLSLPRTAFFNKFNRAMKNAEDDAGFVIEMLRAMQNSPELIAADKHHAELIASEMAWFMRHYGSRWPLRKLERLALHIYYINYGTWLYREHAKPAYREVLGWEISALNFMIAKCFDDEPATTKA